MRVPVSNFVDTFSLKKIIEAPKRIMGPAEIIIGALILGASFNPKKRSGI